MHRQRHHLLPSSALSRWCWKCHQRSAATRAARVTLQWWVDSPAQRRERRSGCCEAGQRQRLTGMTEVWAAGFGQRSLHQHAALPRSDWTTLSKDDPSSGGYVDSSIAGNGKLVGEPWTDDEGDAEPASESLAEATPLPEMDSAQVTMQYPPYPVGQQYMHVSRGSPQTGLSHFTSVPKLSKHA